MEIATEKLLEIIGELEVYNRLQKSIIDRLELDLAEERNPTPIKPQEEAVSDKG